MKAILGLGSNEGERLSFLRAAIRELSFATEGVRVLRASPIYESQAMLPTDAPVDGSWNLPFLNLALECETNLEPPDLLAAVKKVETRLGRESRGRWAPRRIDIDLLAFENRTFSGEGLSVPHPGLGERPFALLPLADLWPEWEPRAALWRNAAPERVPFGTQPTGQSLTELVGIINVTPDSFSDGGLFLNPEQARFQAQALLEQGATVLDIGAESTRPGAHPLSENDEWKRLAPVLESIRSMRSARRFKISVDTRNAETAKRAIEAGTDWINDVGALDGAEMQALAATSAADFVVMHSLGIPPDSRRVLREDQSPVEQILRWGHKKLEDLKNRGVSRDRVILDPGIGFGKLGFQSWDLLSHVERLHELGARILVGHSRKSFLSQITDRPAQERDLESAVIGASLAGRGIQFLRVHDVSVSKRALLASQRLSGITRWT